MPFTLKQHRKFFTWCISIFLILLAFSLLFFAAKGGRDDTVWLYLLLILIFVGATPLVLAITHASSYNKLKKKYGSYTPAIGTVSNWEPCLKRVLGRIYINVDGKDYYSAAYFSSTAAKNLVGKKISYAIIDERIFIYELTGE